MAAEAYAEACAPTGEAPDPDIQAALQNASSGQLSLTDKVIRQTHAHAIASALQHAPLLRSVHLKDLRMELPALELIVQALTQIKSFETLSIVSCALGDDGVKCLQVKQNNTTHDISPQTTPSSCPTSFFSPSRFSKSQPLLRLPSLVLLDLKANDIGNSGASSIAEIYATHPNLRTLDLQRNKIRCQGCIALAAAIQVAGGLEVLNLRFNEVGDAGATALGRAISTNKSLLELQLGGNLIGAEGGVQLAASLVPNRTLVTLNIRSNAIQDAGAVAIAQLCRRNETLSALYLGVNGIGEEGVAAIGDALQHNVSLQKIDLQGATVGTAGSRSISAALKVNRTLRQLAVELAHDDVDASVLIADALKSNTTITELSFGDSIQLDDSIATAINGTLRVNKFINTIGVADELSMDGTTPGPAPPQASLPSISYLMKQEVDASPARTPTAFNISPPRKPSSSPRAPVFATDAAATAKRFDGSRSKTPSRNIHTNTQSRVTGGGGAIASGRGARFVGLPNHTTPRREQKNQYVDGDATTMGINMRMEQLAAALEVRLQSHDATVSRLQEELESERQRVTKLTGDLSEAVVRIQQAEERAANMRGQLEEADARAASMEARADKLERLLPEASAAMDERVGRLTALVDGAKAATDTVAAAQRESAGRVDERLRVAAEAARAQSIAFRDELTATMTAEREAREASLRQLEVMAADTERRLQGEIVDGDTKMRNTVDDSSHALQASVEDTKSELLAKLELTMRNVREGIIGEDQPSALQVLKKTVGRVDELAEGVAELVSHMESLRIKEVSAVAEQRLVAVESKLEARLSSMMSEEGARELESRLANKVGRLESLLHKEQQTSLQALQAILTSSQKSL